MCKKINKRTKKDVKVILIKKTMWKLKKQKTKELTKQLHHGTKNELLKRRS